MAQILKELQEQRDLIIEDYYKEALKADKYMNKEFAAALKIQTYFRMKKVRNKYILKR